MPAPAPRILSLALVSLLSFATLLYQWPRIHYAYNTYNVHPVPANITHTARPAVDLGTHENRVLKYPAPHASYNATLLPDVRYFTHNGFGGHTHQVMAIMKGAFYARMAKRVYIVPSLFPSYFDGPPQQFSRFYDLDQFMQHTLVPMLDWARVKPFNSTHEEHMPCWSLFELFWVHGPNWNNQPLSYHKVHSDYWVLPKLRKNGDQILFSEIATWDQGNKRWPDWFKKVKAEGLPNDPKKKAEKQKPLRVKDGFNLKSPVPTPQLFCLDSTLFLSDYDFSDPPRDPHYEPTASDETEVWKQIGMHLHFSKAVEEQVDKVLAKVLGQSDLPFIAVHMRRGDFKNIGPLPPVDPFIAKVTEIRHSLQARLNDETTWEGPGKLNLKDYGLPTMLYRVLVTTNEAPDSAFYKQVQRIGWHIINHEDLKTAGLYDGWAPTILDAAILSRGAGFVGTAFSTYSNYAALRVKYWNGGVIRMVSQNDYKV